MAAESGIRAPVLRPHAAVPLPPVVPEFRQVRRAPLRRADFEQFGYTDNCPGCANARAGRKHAVDHSEQCRSRMEAILMTTTEGHERLERARDRFAQAVKEPEDEAPHRKRRRPEGEGRHPLAPPWEGGGSSSRIGWALLPAPPPAPPPLAKRSLEQETKMTDATVEQQGESKSRREHPEVPQAAESSSGSISSSSSESSTDTEMGLVGLVDLCTILCDNSELSKRGRASGKPVAEGCEGGLVRERVTGKLVLQMQKIDRKFEIAVADLITD